MNEVQRCTWCIMDNSSDETITFDSTGRCNYCRAAAGLPQLSWSAEEKAARLETLLNEMKRAGKGKEYDCIMGLSGGLDSSYLALLGHRWGLRVLAVHIDDGFDSDVSKNNLRGLVEATGFRYLTITPDADQYADLIRAYMAAGVPNIAVPQDNILFAFLHKEAKEYGIRYFASGGNYSLESILQAGNTHTAYDLVNLRDIHRRFGSTRIDRLPLLSTFRRLIDRRPGGLRTVTPLDLVDYRRDEAFRELREFCGFEYYGRKHLENRLTEFVQLYWFYHKFGVDKRTSHLSSMIVSNQLSREDALIEYAKPIYVTADMESCIDFIRTGLNISKAEFENLMAGPARQHEFYETEKSRLWYRAGFSTLKLAATLKSRILA